MDNKKNKKVLIVDDSRVSRMMIHGFIQEQRPEWAVREAAGGVEALAMVSDELPDIITLDMNMPGLSGLDTAQKIKERFPAICIALLTANVQEGTRNRAEALGLHFMEKPITAEVIRRVIGLVERS